MFVKYVPNVPQIRNGMYLPLNQINKKVFEKNIDLCISETLRLDESYQFLTNIFSLFFLLNFFFFYEGGDEPDRDGLRHQFLLDGDDIDKSMHFHILSQMRNILF